MPYTSANSPVRNALPSDANSLWVRVFNSTLKDSNDETKARMAAWGAVKNGWRKAGDKWVKKELSTPAYIAGAPLIRENLFKPKKKK